MLEGRGGRERKGREKENGVEGRESKEKGGNQRGGEGRAEMRGRERENQKDKGGHEGGEDLIKSFTPVLHQMSHECPWS